MSCTLVITDNAARSAGLVRGPADRAPFDVLDLYDGTVPAEPASCIVVDLQDLHSQAVARLREILALARRDAPLVMLLHRNTSRGRMLASAIGATRTLFPPFDLPALRAVLNDPRSLAETDPLSPCALQVTCQARDYFAAVFSPSEPLTQAVVGTGSAFIGQAVQETGIRDWVRAVRRFDDVTHQHCLLVTGLAAAFGQALGLGDYERHRLTKAALLHDVGKIHVPKSILNKPGKLDANETAVMQRHAEMGHAMLVGQDFHPEILQVVRSHHEMLDGSGYPDRLKAHEIPDLVRVLTVCDIYAALIERRPYKTPITGEKAFAILEGMTGRLDATIVEAFRPVAAAFVPRLPY